MTTQSLKIRNTKMIPRVDNTAWRSLLLRVQLSAVLDKFMRIVAPSQGDVYIFEKLCFNPIEVFPSLEKYFSRDHNLTGLTRGLIAGKARLEFLGTKVEESSTISFLRPRDDFDLNLRPRQSLLLGFPWSSLLCFSPTRWSRCSRDPGFLLVLVKWLNNEWLNNRMI